jgi:hypothetical protein
MPLLMKIKLPDCPNQGRGIEIGVFGGVTEFLTGCFGSKIIGCLEASCLASGPLGHIRTTANKAA